MRRVDVVAALVARGLAASPDDARALVDAGRVTAGGAPVASHGRLVASGEQLAVRAAREPVGRGGAKLEGAIAAWGVRVDGRRCLDVGASTGGFTEVLLGRGAAEVVALDVGTGLLHERLAADPRVAVVDGTHVREVPALLAARDAASPWRAPFSLVVVDLSFISTASVAGAIWAAVAPGGEALVLVKPQYEATREEASRGGGVVADPGVWRRTCEEVAAAFGRLGGMVDAPVRSPIDGRGGNAEFFLRVRRAPPT